MAALDEIVVSAARPFANFLGMLPKVKIGELPVPVTLHEDFSDTIKITDHPVESGANITDHSYAEPVRVVLTCGWSNSDYSALLQQVVGVFKSLVAGKSPISEMSNNDYVTNVYQQLLKIQKAREPITITTTMRLYKNMLVEHLQVQRDVKTSAVLVVVAACREVIIVSTQSSALTDTSKQSKPSETADPADGGQRNLTPGTPANSADNPVG